MFYFRRQGPVGGFLEDIFFLGIAIISNVVGALLWPRWRVGLGSILAVSSLLFLAASDLRLLVTPEIPEPPRYSADAATLALAHLVWGFLSFVIGIALVIFQKFVDGWKRWRITLGSILFLVSLLSLNSSFIRFRLLAETPITALIFLVLGMILLMIGIALVIYQKFIDRKSEVASLP